MDAVVTNLLENASAYFVTQLSGHIPLVSLAHPLLSGVAHLLSGLEQGGKAMTAEVGRSIFEHVMRRFAAHDDHAVIVAILKDLRAWAGDIARPFLDHDDPRRAWSLVDLLLTIVIGVLEDGILTNGFGVIADKDFRQWLNQKGADPLVSNGPLIQSLYDIFFAYEGGDVSRPSVEAGPALRGSLRTMLTYQGHVLYKMNAGMGDTVFAPLYLALKQRGVTFKFFHRVEKLVYDEATNAISAIEIARQVDLNVPEYAPLVDVKGLPCWPSTPLTDQIVNGQALKGVDLESMWSGWTDAGHTTLQLGQDFDQVVLGITVAGLPFICDEKLLALRALEEDAGERADGSHPGRAALVQPYVRGSRLSRLPAASSRIATNPMPAGPISFRCSRGRISHRTSRRSSTGAASCPTTARSFRRRRTCSSRRSSWHACGRPRCSSCRTRASRSGRRRPSGDPWIGRPWPLPASCSARSAWTASICARTSTRPSGTC